MKFRLALFAVAVSLPGISMEADYWILRTDNQTAGFLQSAMKERKLKAAELEERIGKLVFQRKITELARAQGSGEQFREEIESGTMEIREVGEEIQLGAFLEGSLHAAPDAGMPYLASSLQLLEKTKRHRYHECSITHTPAEIDDQWQCIHYWRDASTTTMMLARLDELDPAISRERRIPVVEIEVSLYSVDARAIAVYQAAPEAKRGELAASMVKSADLLRHFVAQVQSGDRLAHRHLINWIHENDDKEWDTAMLGLDAMIGATAGPEGETADLNLEAYWQDPEKFSPDPGYEFRHVKTSAVDQPVVVLPSKSPDKAAESLVMILTPRMPVAPQVKPRNVSRSCAATDGLYVEAYPVPPSFPRILSGKNPPGGNRPMRELLESKGLTFSKEGSMAVFQANSSTVILRSDASDHQRLVKLIAEVKAADD